jgi:polyketide biosynthesis acyl carrier protein
MSLERDRERVTAVVRARIREVLGDLPLPAIDAARSLEDLGANSIDRVEIAALSMQDLELDFPLHELGDVATLQGLIEALADRLR